MVMTYYNVIGVATAAERRRVRAYWNCMRHTSHRHMPSE